MRYTTSIIADTAKNSVAAILWYAADIAATNTEVSDPIHTAAGELIITGDTTHRRYRTATELAALIATNRHPGLTAKVDDDNWATWQQELTEPWPILADAANIAARISGHEAHITPGHWTL